MALHLDMLWAEKLVRVNVGVVRLVRGHLHVPWALATTLQRRRRDDVEGTLDTIPTLHLV